MSDQGDFQKRLTNRPRRGLVLAGGGAKGAFGFGCLKALAELGVRFDAVAGTSVGGLNAALWSAYVIDRGEVLWRNLDFKRVCKLRILWPLALFQFFVRSNLHDEELISPKELRRWWLSSGLWGALLFAVVKLLIGQPLQYALIGAAINPFLFLAVLGTFTYILYRHGITLFDPTPLRELISETLRDRPLKIPTFVTVARDHNIFDAVAPSVVVESIGPGITRSEESAQQFAWLPEYYEIAALRETERNFLLAATSALPYAIFPEISFCGKKFSDGGIADNCPLLPLLLDADCTELVIVSLAPLDRNWINGKLHECRKNHRRRSAAGLVPRLEVAASTESIRILTVSPPKSLGNFFSGTMRFQSKYTRRLLQEGTDSMWRAWGRQEWITISRDRFTERKPGDYKTPLVTARELPYLMRWIRVNFAWRTRTRRG